MRASPKHQITGETALDLVRADRPTEDGAVVEVRIERSGRISADGVEVDLVELEEILDDLAREEGMVWYSRESPAEEPTHAQGQAIDRVMEAIIRRRLPLRLQDGG